MISENIQETASLYVFDLLELAEARAFEAEVAGDAELREYVDGLRETAAGLAHRAPLREPPPELAARILDEIRAEKKVMPFPLWRRAAPWALAAGLAVLCGIFFAGEQRLKREMAALAGRGELSKLQAFVLASKLAGAPDAAAVVIWDPEKQTGVIKLSGMPEPGPERDYQLWIIDPRHPAPVDAGILPIRTDGISTVSFHGNRVISDAEKFAISLERKGGAPAPEGPIVMLSN